jgi:hypothetical protein
VRRERHRGESTRLEITSIHGVVSCRQGTPIDLESVPDYQEGPVDLAEVILNVQQFHRLSPETCFFLELARSPHFGRLVSLNETAR